MSCLPASSLSERSFLFVPGDRPERFDKARASGADAVIVDLEDAVVADRKGVARGAARAWLDRGNRAIIRINGVGTEWHDGDCELFDRHPAAAVMLPKAESPAVLADFVARVGVDVVALVETAVGIWNVRELAAVAGLTRLAFGSIDFQLDAGIPEEGAALDYARSRLVLASAAAGLPAPIDGVTATLDDAAVLQADIARARALGFGGKLCIHPRQVEAVNRSFAPSEQEVAWTRAVVSAAERAQLEGAVQLDGRLVDRPVVERARRTINALGRS